MSLNPDQALAVTFDGPLLMVAGPGSGKTKTLVSKADNILKANPNNRIALVTFTDASTKEMRERLHKAVSPDGFRRCNVQTFHKHCINQLRAGGKLGRLLSPQQAVSLVRRALINTGLVMDEDEAVVEVEKAKLRLDFTGKENALVEAYEALRIRQRVMDLWDVTREAVVGMRRGDLQPLDVTHILGDEYQDTDDIQQAWMFEHAARGRMLTVVGDDDQSIYGWRRALGFKGMMDFREHVNAATVVFGVNYRSRAEILLCADAVIRNNAQRVAKVIHPHRGSGGHVEICPYRDALQEAECVAARIKQDCLPLAGDIVAPKRQQWAVIARTNAAFLVLTSVLRSEGIAYQRSGRDKVADVPRLYCEFLGGMARRDPLVMEQVLHAAKVSDEAIGHLVRSSEKGVQTIYDGKLEDSESLPPEDKEVVVTFARLCRAWRGIASGGGIDDVLEAVQLWFSDNVAGGDNDKEALGFYRVLMSRLKGRLDQRASRLLRDEGPADGDGVQLHTMHSSKGLEFDKVAVIACNSGVIPSSKSESIDEERRLFYVAITRAKDELYLCYQANKGRSPFIGEVNVGLSAIEAARAEAKV